MIPDQLPELLELIPRFQGVVYAYEGKMFYHPDKLAEVLRWWLDTDSNELARIGFKVYRILEYDNRGIFVVRNFSCALSNDDLARLSGQAT